MVFKNLSSRTITYLFKKVHAVIVKASALVTQQIAMY